MDALKFMNNQMSAIGVPYEFGEWTSDVKYPYFVGEISEDPIYTEDGLEESTFILTGFHRGKYIDLETIKKRIKAHFHPTYGARGRTDHGRIVVLYEGAFPIPTGEAGLKKIQINLKIKEWKVKYYD